MAIELLFGMFLRAQLAASLAIGLVLLLRPQIRHLFGAELAYSLWLLAPAAAVASLFPVLPEYLGHGYLGRVLRTGRYVDWAPVIAYARPLATAWILGTVVAAVLLVASQRRFEAKARLGEAGPAAAGFWPRMVVPSDYAQRFTEEERVLIRAHERAHMARRDPTTNLLIALGQAVGWPNPLVHIAARLARLDQELSVDAQVLASHPSSRRRYALTLLKAQAKGFDSPLACALAVGSRHPLEVRLRMLGLKRISVGRDRAGAIIVGFCILGAAFGLWAFAPI